MNKEFLLELYSGEIPAPLQLSAAMQLKEAFDTSLINMGLSGFESQYFYSSRRLTLLINNLDEFIAAQEIQVRGPKIGANESAIEGFAKANAVKISELSIADYKGSNHYFYTKITKKQATAEILKIITEKILTGFYWPKSMKWDDSGIRWVRPLLNILAIYQEEIVNIKFGNINSSNISFGHFFISNKALKIKDFNSYQNALNENQVMFDQNIRKNYIIENAQKLAANLNLTPILDENLLNELTGIVELPNLVMGNIAEKFLNLPSEVLISSIKTHQKYICTRGASGELADKFIVVTNSLPINNDIVLRGNERVLTARLNDAMFYFHEDQKISLLDRAEKLSRIVFHNKLGTLADKSERMKILAQDLATKLNYQSYGDAIKIACDLAKADLTTEMVGEFPELQGVMGYYYAKLQNHDEEIALAIKEHYMPIGRSDQCPTKPLAIILALADKIDSVVGLFYAGEKPTGSKDQYALRRMALGIIRIMIDNKITIDINALFESSIVSYHNINQIKITNEIIEEIKLFMAERLVNLLKTFDYDHKVIECIASKFNDIYLAKVKVDILCTQYNKPQNIDAFNALKRVIKFTKSPDEAVDPKLFIEPAEHKLFEAITDIEEAKPSPDFCEKYLNALLALHLVINEYLDNIVVNHSDPAIKQNRLAIIGLLRNKILVFGDLGLL